MAYSEDMTENQLIVENIEDEEDDNSVVKLQQEKMEQLGIFNGDCVLLKGKRERNTVCIAFWDKQCPPNSIKMNLGIRMNLRVMLGGVVSVFPLRHIDYGKRIHVLPIDDSIQGKSCNLFSAYLNPYLGGNKTAYRPLHEGDIFKVGGPHGTVEFKVIATEPKPFCVVSPETVVYFQGSPIERNEINKEMNAIGYDSVGGYKKELMAIREVIDLSLRHPSVFYNAGLQPPRGILLYGPPGTGKSLIIEAIKKECGTNFIGLDCHKIKNEEQYETPENHFIAILSLAVENAPAIIFIDHIDSIAPHRENDGEDLVSIIIALFDGIKENNIVIATTNRLSDIDPALRRFGRFDREICIGNPDLDDRIDILRKLTRRLNLARDVNIEQLAKQTHGLVGSDLASLCVNATMKNRIKRKRHLDDGINRGTINSLNVSMEDFRPVLFSMSFQNLQENILENTKISWEDIGGLQVVKNNLQDMIEFPKKIRERFLKHGLPLKRGILLYGPPGCGKTLLAKAIASKCGANFIYINGGELLSKSVGESEIKISDIFDKVKRIDPCVLFIDDLDSIARKRSNNRGDDCKTCESMINQLLMKLDSINPNKNVFIVSATNRPHDIDNAILRPGRIDEMIYIPLPDKECRKCIFEVILKKFPLADYVDLDFLAENSDGFSGADLSRICKIAFVLAMKENETKIRENCQDNNFKIHMDHFNKALNDARPSVCEDKILKYSDFFEKKQKTNQIMYKSDSY